MGDRSDQHVASTSIRINGTILAPELMELLTEVKIKESLLTPASALLRFSDPGLGHVDDKHFDIGGQIEISLGAQGETSLEPIFKGDIVAFEPEFLKDGCVISVRAYDHSHRLQRTRKVRTFQDVKATDIITKLLREAGIKPQVSDTKVKYKYFLQSGETDRELIRRFEREYNCQFFVQDGVGKFRAVETGAAALTLTYGAELMTFRPRISSAQQVKEVSVRGWDPLAKKAVVSTKQNNGTSSKPGLTRSDVEKAFKNNTVLIADRTVETMSEADAMAQSFIDARADAYAEAEGTMLGEPKLRAGKHVKIEGVGTKLSGTYLLSSVTHWYRGEKGFYTHFDITGRSARGLLDLVHPPQRRDWASQLVIGVVTNTKDPDSMGRIKVKFPSLLDGAKEAESHWARMVTMGAGKDRGLIMMPVLDDEVVVAFENGDPRRPLIIGALFNGKGAPNDDMMARGSNGEPSGGGQTDGSFALVSSNRGFVHTPKDLTIKSGKKMVLTIESDRTEKTNGKVVSEGAQSVELKAGTSYTIKAGSSMKLEGASIAIEATGSLSLKGSTVTIEGSVSSTLKGATVNVEGQAMTNVKGAIVNLG
jgi:uncharacterized protein involved in type VI secretion and phage assembly